MEVEIKLHVLPTVEGGPAAFFERLSRLDRLAGLPLGPVERIALRDLYYDTADGALARAGAGLRLRAENGERLITLKIGRSQEGALTVREEYEHPFTPEHLEEILGLLRPLIGESLVPVDSFGAGLAAGPLMPVLETVTERLARRVGELAVLTLDRVEYPVLTSEIFWDVEVEVRRGDDGVSLLRTIECDLGRVAEGHLHPASISKLQRGIQLRSGLG